MGRFDILNEYLLTEASAFQFPEYTVTLSPLHYVGYTALQIANSFVFPHRATTGIKFQIRIHFPARRASHLQRMQLAYVKSPQ